PGVRKHVEESVAIVFEVLALLIRQFCECLLARRPDLLKDRYELIEMFLQAQTRPQRLLRFQCG
ncbi:hypothetical protein ACQ7B2_00115, partial [Escherichia coli]